MTWLSASDPQALLSLYAGVVPPTVTASGQGDLATADQRAAQLGDSIPVVWARWRNGAGGVLLSPPATEVRYENNKKNQLTFYYHFVLSDGQISPIETRDVFLGTVRKGEFNQSFNRRAGTWIPGNYITANVSGEYFIYNPVVNAQQDEYRAQGKRYDLYVNLDNEEWYDVTYSLQSTGFYSKQYLVNGIPVRPTFEFNFAPKISFSELTQYCGSVGTYEGVSTLSFSYQTEPLVNENSPLIKKSVNLFIRGGVNVTRLADGVYGPSDNFADLILWLMQRSSRIPAEMIDITALTATAVFLERQGFTCNCVISERTSIPDLIASWGPYFLVTQSRNNGKLGLRPVLPTDAQGNILTGPLTYAYRFTVDNVLPDSLEINYSTLGNRQPFTVQSRWRQQPANDLGIARVLETRYAGTAEAGPFELHDLSAFATSELHAARVGAHLLARRCHIEHTARLRARPGGHSTSLAPGAVVRVTMPREASSGGEDTWDHLYQVERISRTLAGDVAYELTHLPVNADRRSLVALDVVSAVGTGILLSPQRSGILQDSNSSSDATIPADVGIDPTNAAAGDASSAGKAEELENSLAEEVEPIGPEDGPEDPQADANRLQSDPTAPAALEPITCDTGEQAQYVDWYIRPNEYSDFKPYRVEGRKAQPILPIQPGSQPSERRIITPGAQYYAKYYCPKPTDTTPEMVLNPSNARYTRPYTITPLDLAPFEPLSAAPGVVPGGQSVAYKIRVLRNDGPPWNPVYWDETAVNGLAYHHIVFSPGIVIGYQNLPYNYSNPADTGHASIQIVVAQGPSIIAFDIINFFIGPTASLASGSQSVTPSDWQGYTWGPSGAIIKAP